MTQELTCTVTHLLIGRSRDTLETSCVARVEATFEGLVGDQHAGLTRRSDVRVPHYPRGTIIRNTRQVSILSEEELAEVAAKLDLPRVLPAWLGANLALRGIPNLTMLPPSTRIFFPEDAVLVVDAENMPCVGPGKVIQQHNPDVPKLAQNFPKAAMHKRGLVGWVERPGYINEGDSVRVMLPPRVMYSY
ncbi:MAG TPA: MOSC domain-containing protein [Ktedonobacteraceae bacterium]|nr:MOSC domain-containing protein [Ktedonobacteraceae bacterium]